MRLARRALLPRYPLRKPRGRFLLVVKLRDVLSVELDSSGSCFQNIFGEKQFILKAFPSTLHLLQTMQVMYPYVPQNDDELELMPGDFIFMSPVEQSSASEGWVYGTSLGTGLSGLLPENYVTHGDESDTWVVHG